MSAPQLLANSGAPYLRALPASSWASLVQTQRAETALVSAHPRALSELHDASFERFSERPSSQAASPPAGSGSRSRSFTLASAEPLTFPLETTQHAALLGWPLLEVEPRNAARRLLMSALASLEPAAGSVQVEMTQHAALLLRSADQHALKEKTDHLLSQLGRTPQPREPSLAASSLRSSARRETARIVEPRCAKASATASRELDAPPSPVRLLFLGPRP